MYKSPIMGAGREGGLRVDARPTTFLKKIHVGAFYFFLQKGLFSCGESFFLMRAFWGVCPPPPTPVLQIIVLAPMPPPHERTKKFSEGGGQSQKASHKDEKRHKDKKNAPPPTWRKNSKKAPTR